jgi:hypothetical protein
MAFPSAFARELEAKSADLLIEPGAPPGTAQDGFQ